MNLQVFKNSRFGEIRTIEENGQVLFCGSDVAKALGYKNTTKALSDHCRGVTKRYTGVQTGLKADGTPAMQNIEMNFIPEGDIYRLAAKSELPGAVEFERWIFDEVLPTIRRTGSYSAKPMTQIELLAAQAQAMVELERKADTAIQAADTANQRLTGALDALAAPTEKDWQTVTGNKIKRIAQENQLSYVALFGDLYKELEDCAKVNLKSRLVNLRKRMERGGATYKERREISKLHIISLDPKLKLAFDGIVRRTDAKYAACRVPTE